MNDLREQVERAATPTERGGSTSVWWLAGCLVLALAAVLGLALALVADRDETSPTTPSAEVVALLDERIAAINRVDGAAAAALYAEDAVLDEIEGEPYPSSTATYTFVGRAEIEERLQGLAEEAGLRLEAVGEPVQLGNLVAEPTRFLQEGGSGYGEGILVFEIDDQGTIAHQWMIGWVEGG